MDGQKVQEVRIVYNFVGEIPEIAAPGDCSVNSLPHLSITEGWGFYVAYRWPVFSFKWLKFVRDGCAMNLRFIRDLRTIYRRFSAPVYPGAHNVRPRHAPFCRRQANACQALHR